MRPHRFVRSLTKVEERRIEELHRRGRNRRVRRRAQAIRLSAKGYTVQEIAEIIGCIVQSVHNWLNAFEEDGCKALEDRSRSGRPAIVTPDYRARLVEVVKTDPQEFAYPFTVWSVVRLRAHMAREMHVLLSDTHIRRVMKEEGLVFKRPKHSLREKRDSDAFAEVRDILERVKKSPWNPVPV